MNNKGSFGQGVMWLFVFVVGSLIITFLVSPDSFQSFKSNVQSISGNMVSSLSNSINNQSDDVSIKDLTQNPSKYIGSMKISGTLTRRLGGTSIDDSEGYWIWLDDNRCLENQRNYNYGSQIYSAYGHPGSDNEYRGGVTFYCDAPIS